MRNQMAGPGDPSLQTVTGPASPHIFVGLATLTYRRQEPFFSDGTKRALESL
jgi:hypothetical protein